MGVPSSSSLSSSPVLTLLDRARGAVSAREGRLLDSLGTASASSLSSQRPPPPSPPGMNLRRLFGGSVASSLREFTRDLAGVRVGRRGESSVEAIVKERRGVCGAVSVVVSRAAVGTGEASQSGVSRRRCCAARAWLCGVAEEGGMNAPRSKLLAPRRRHVTGSARWCCCCCAVLLSTPAALDPVREVGGEGATSFR